MAHQTKRLNIPGEHRIEVPGSEIQKRMQWLRPFVRQSGDEWREPWFLKKRILLDYLMVFIADGTGLFSVGESTFNVGKGDLIWIPPATPHEMHGHAPKMRCLYVHFDLMYNPRRSHWDSFIPGGTMNLTGFEALRHPPVDDPVIGSWNGKLPIANQPVIQSLIEDICLEHSRAPADAALSLSGKMIQLIQAIIDGNKQEGARGREHSPELQRAASLILEQTEKDLDVSRLALSVKMSPSHFRKVFREAYGQSARSMHRQARIRKACSLLVYHSLAISQVSDMLGFSTVHNFSRAFKEVTGMAPGEYRRSGEA